MAVENKEELVSVVIITYKSASTVLETLESIKAQTYNNIELIVADDCSPDNTAQVVEEWLKENSDVFIRTVFLKNAKNLGPSGNLNRGYKEAKGVWVKSLAGDDTLIPEAINTYLDFANKHPESPILTAKLKAFSPNGESCERDQMALEKLYAKLKVDSREQQYKNALRSHILAGPGLFIKKTFFDELGGFNEKYPMGEEYDFELRVFKKVFVPVVDEYLVNWRVSPTSLSHKMSLKSVQSDYLFFKEVKARLMLVEKMYLAFYEENIDFLIALHPKCYAILKFLKLLKPSFWNKFKNKE